MWLFFCSVSLPRGTVGWSVVCECGISRQGSLAFYYQSYMYRSIYKLYCQIHIDTASWNLVLKNKNSKSVKMHCFIFANLFFF